MGRELSEENRLLLTITKKNAEERIATFLLSLSTRYNRLGYSSTEFKLSMSRSEIGNYLGLTIETVSRTLNKFQKQKLIEIERKYVRIKELTRLKGMCTPSLSGTRAGGSVA
jgi:CRP/FNR family transcriptional regulator